MRITESQLRRIVRQEILRESALPTNDLQKMLERAGVQVLGVGGSSAGGILGDTGPTVEILGPKPNGTLIKLSMSAPLMGQFSQYLLISSERGMFMVMPATPVGEIDQSMMRTLGLPPEGFSSIEAMIGWMITNLPLKLSGMGGILGGMGGSIFGR